MVPLAAASVLVRISPVNLLMKGKLMYHWVDKHIGHTPRTIDARREKIRLRVFEKWRTYLLANPQSTRNRIVEVI